MAGRVLSYQYDGAGRLTSVTVPGGAVTRYGYDASNLTCPAPGGTTAAYTWDQANRLTGANGATATYSASGLRATRTPAGGTTQHYAFDTRAGVPLMLTDGATSYLYDDAGNPVEHIDATGTDLYYQHDQYGSTRLLTDGDGTVAATYTYDAYGNLTNKTGSEDTALRWGGQTQDTDTGLYYLRARYYDPQSAQFISTDPLAAITKAVYAYAKSNPLNMADQTGLDWGWPTDWTPDNWKVVATIGAVIGVVAFAATGVGLVAELGIAGGAFALGGTAATVASIAGTAGLVLGAAGTAIDGAACAWHRPNGQSDSAACAGFALGMVGGVFGGVAKFGGKALLGEFAGADARVVKGNEAGWDLAGGLFGTGGTAVDLYSCVGPR